MLKEQFFRVADFTFEVCMPEEWDIERLLPSFRPFRHDGSHCNAPLFRLAESSASDLFREESVLLEESVNDMGYVRLLRTSTGYRTEIRFTADGTVHYLHTDPHFTSAEARICRDDPYAGEVLSSMLRIVFSQAVVYHGGISVHAATVVLDGKAYLFMGKSGTGKSTHATLWRECFPGCMLLNDDNPVIRIVNGRAMVYGSPWSGKTPCYKNLCYPIGGIVRLGQAKENRFIRQEDVGAFIAVLPGCSVIRQDPDQYGRLCDTLVHLAGQVAVGRLECLPDRQAAILCRKEINRINQHYQKNE